MSKSPEEVTSNLHSVGKIDELLLALELQPGTFDYRATVLDWLNSAVETKPEPSYKQPRKADSVCAFEFAISPPDNYCLNCGWLVRAHRSAQKASAPAGDWVIVCGDSWYGDNGKFVRNEWEARGFPSCRDAQEFAKGMRCPWSVHERTQYKRPERKAENGTVKP